MELVVALIAAASVVMGPILLVLVRSKIEIMKQANTDDHAKVVSSVDVLSSEINALMSMVVESSTELKSHIRWCEETMKDKNE